MRLVFVVDVAIVVAIVVVVVAIVVVVVVVLVVVAVVVVVVVAVVVVVVAALCHPTSRSYLSFCARVVHMIVVFGLDRRGWDVDRLWRRWPLSTDRFFSTSVILWTFYVTPQDGFSIERCASLPGHHPNRDIHTLMHHQQAEFLEVGVASVSFGFSLLLRLCLCWCARVCVCACARVCVCVCVEASWSCLFRSLSVFDRETP